MPDSQVGSQLDFSPSSRKYEVAVVTQLSSGVSADNEHRDEDGSDHNVIRWARVNLFIKFIKFVNILNQFKTSQRLEYSQFIISVVQASLVVSVIVFAGYII